MKRLQNIMRGKDINTMPQHGHALEELADILEVVCALCSAQGHSADELMRIYEKSILSAAAFQRGFFCWGRIQE